VSSLSRREFLQALAAAGAAGLPLRSLAQADAATAARSLYELPRFGQVSLLHMTDCHAQLMPLYFREPGANLGSGAMKDRLPHAAPGGTRVPRRGRPRLRRRPGQAITREAMMEQLAITYPSATITEMSGESIKAVMEDVADNLFNPDPYLQQGGDMVRVGGMTYAIEPGAAMGSRIHDMRLAGRPIEPGKSYRVAGWAAVAEAARVPGARPVWELVEAWLKTRSHVAPRRVNVPRLIGVDNNPGWADRKSVV
jgi:2',3'-cyclic-nucleotide 2'-phosphodiesterase (5'-nucleotidase family)